MNHSKPMLFICQGKACRKNEDRLVAVHDALEKIAPLESVKCQKICHAQVVGVRLGDKLRWVKKVRSKNHTKMLKRWLKTGRCPKKLKSLRVKKRNNKLRR